MPLLFHRSYWTYRTYSTPGSPLRGLPGVGAGRRVNPAPVAQGGAAKEARPPLGGVVSS